MASMLAQRSAGLQGFAAKSSRKASVSRKAVLVRAEEKAVAKVDRSKDTLYFADANSLKYLDGTLPGDFGFDPLGLLDPTTTSNAGFVNPEWLKYSEVFHGRWAMLGAAGCIAPEILAAAGVTPTATGVEWFRASVIPPAGVFHEYWMDPFSLFWLEVVAMGFAEHKRLQDYRYPGSQGKQYFLGLEASFKGSGNPAYPGGPWFNMFNLGKSEGEMNRMKLAEIKNGRLAMLAMLGYGAQAVMTSKGPFGNLVDHLSDPGNNNLLANFGKITQH